jgi:hypothetical protein
MSLREDRQKQVPSGDDNKKGNDKSNCRSFDRAVRKERELIRSG